MNEKWKMIFILLLLATVTVWISVLLFPEKKLKVIACNVGQGDAILITYGSTQILTDGGPDSSVLECLSDNIAFWDREIELVIMSHPQLDHFGGLIEVMERYEVGQFMTTGLESSSPEYQVLEDAVGGGETKVVTVEGGQSYYIGLIYLDMLWPTKSFVSANSAVNNANDDKILGAFSSTHDHNDFSLVTLISYEDFEILLTGDINPEVSDILAEKLKRKRYNDIEILKVPHHGSKNGMTENFLKVVDPDTAIISSGKNNRYGHPHQEIIDMLGDQKVNILRTDSGKDVVIYKE